MSKRDLQNALSRVRCVVLDMDGTIYLGNQLFDHTPPFLKGLTERNIRPVFLTNNSSRSITDYVSKLTGMGVTATAEDIFSSADATISYLQNETKHQRVFLLGTASLEQQFKAAGFVLTYEESDCVVFGYDRELTFDKLNCAYKLVAQGVPLIATHPDKLCPTPDGFDIDTGSMIQALVTATGVEPIVAGKPDARMIDGVCNRFGYQREQLLVMGDRLSTDIQLGLNSEVLSALVLTGEATREDVTATGIEPDLILDRNIDLLQWL